MTAKFVTRNGETFRILHRSEDALWLISFDAQTERPFCVTAAEMDTFQRIQSPITYVSEESDLSPAAKKRLDIIQPLLDQGAAAITDRELRLSLAKETAVYHGTTYRRVLRIYYRYLSTGQVSFSKKREPIVNQNYDWAIKTFYFSAKKFSLRAAYDMMLVQRYSAPDGKLLENLPSWSSFRNYFYTREFHKQPRKAIARSGLTNYQRNERPAFGSASDWRTQPGSYQMDATMADIYLVSRHDRSKVIGRPYIYLAVDTATHLIAGIYVGLECDETAVMLCLNNASLPKDSYCAAFGIRIAADQWPSQGLSHEIITDKGNEFFGPRMKELCQRYGIEVQSLPPFRPDGKGLVEKAFDLIQQRYKPLLRGKGVIEPDAQERWAVDYRSQSVLDLDEFTKIVIHCVLYINVGRYLADGNTPAQKWAVADSHLLDVPSLEIMALALSRERVKLTRKGVRVNPLLYVPIDMDGLTLGEKYTVCYNPSNLSLVYVLMDDRSLKICQLSSCQSQYDGLSRTEADLLKREERERRGAAGKHEVEASVMSIQSIREIVQSAETAGTEKKGQDGKEILENRSNERRKLS